MYVYHSRLIMRGMARGLRLRAGTAPREVSANICKIYHTETGTLTNTPHYEIKNVTQESFTSPNSHQ